MPHPLEEAVIIKIQDSTFLRSISRQSATQATNAIIPEILKKNPRFFVMPTI